MSLSTLGRQLWIPASLPGAKEQHSHHFVFYEGCLASTRNLFNWLCLGFFSPFTLLLLKLSPMPNSMHFWDPRSKTRRKTLCWKLFLDSFKKLLSSFRVLAFQIMIWSMLKKIANMVHLTERIDANVTRTWNLAQVRHTVCLEKIQVW